MPFHFDAEKARRILEAPQPPAVPMTIGTCPACGVEVTEEHREGVEDYICPACHQSLPHQCPHCGSGEPAERFLREGMTAEELAVESTNVDGWFRCRECERTFTGMRYRLGRWDLMRCFYCGMIGPKDMLCHACLAPQLVPLDWERMAVGLGVEEKVVYDEVFEERLRRSGIAPTPAEASGEGDYTGV